MGRVGVNVTIMVSPDAAIGRRITAIHLDEMHRHAEICRIDVSRIDISRTKFTPVRVLFA
jgi:hypothetical protein